MVRIFSFKELILLFLKYFIYWLTNNRCLRLCKTQYISYICTIVYENEYMRGRKVPSFYTIMFKKKVEDLLKVALDERQDLFLISMTIGADNAIKIVIDGDNGVLVEDCMFVSRAIEHNLDREEEDFSLEILSSGATSPLLLPRQYQKHVGRNLEVNTKDNQNIEGELIEADQNTIQLEWKTREPKPVGKGKVTVTKNATIAFAEIKEAKVKIKF